MTPESITNCFLRAPGGKPGGHVLRDNVADWLLWTLFSARSTEVLDEREEELESLNFRHGVTMSATPSAAGVISTCNASAPPWTPFI
jgi:hypothetical protein